MGDILRPLAIGFAIFIGAVLTLGAIGASAALILTVSKAIVALTLLATAQSAFSGNRNNIAPFDPRNLNPDVATPRKLVFGNTPMVMDLRYYEPSGENDEFVDYITALAAHRIAGLDELHIDDKLAWTAAGGAQGEFAGYLTIEVINEAGPSAFHTVNSGTRWGSTTRMTGCATMKVRVKRSNNSKNDTSPLSGGLTGRIAAIGRGMPVYDPRRDSTVPGGSGAHRADNPATWQYADGAAQIGRNPALQALAVLLGWRINGIVSVGVGLAPARLPMAKWAAAANICDELVSDGFISTEPRYRHDRAFQDSDDPLAIIEEIFKSCNGELIDEGGTLSPRLAINDLVPVLTLTDSDLVGGMEWTPVPPVQQQYTLVRGRYMQREALYELADLPEVVINRPSAVPRPLTVELPGVTSFTQGQRVLRQVARRQLFQGTLQIRVGVRGLLLRQNDVFALSSNVRGWPAKLFRVRRRGLAIEANQDGAYQMIVNIEAREEDASIYTVGSLTAPLVLPNPERFNQRFAASWLMAGIAPEADVTVDQPIVSRMNPSTGTALQNFLSQFGNPFAQLVASGEARDGDVVNFPTTLPSVPKIFFLPGGRAAATGENIDISAEALSTTGFVMRARGQAVTAGATITDGSSTLGGTGEPQRVINRTNGGAPFNGRFTYRFSVTVGNIAPGEPGFAEIGLFARIGGNWQEVGAAAMNSG
ncbi:MAG: phage tail protein [Sandarakinorhabdus sp.]|nr:phage tail protein [Sandarakinorhabdus sp.]